MKNLLFPIFLLLLIPTIAKTQVDAMIKDEKVTTGINWITGLSWDQVMQKAKSENKYIFLDVFATWCGPCKAMDKFVYPNDTIGKLFNDRFISAKVQVDRTNLDGEEVRNWYKDAEQIQKQFHIRSYPTFVFLAPDGTISHMESGYKGVNDLVVVAQTAIQPGKIFVDPYNEYYTLMEEYTKGNRNYKRMAFLIDTALMLREDTSITNGLLRDFRDNYLHKLPAKEVYSDPYLIRFLSKYIGSKSKMFSLFYPDGRKADESVGQKGFAQNLVDKIIQQEVINPILSKYTGDGRLITYTDPNYTEPKWKEIRKAVSKRYNSMYAKRCVLWSQVIWYDKYADIFNLSKCYLEFLKQYGFDTTITQNMSRLNHIAWEMFKKNDRKEDLEGIAKWMKALIDSYSYGPYIDTYANLIYKLGKVAEAIKWEEIALSFSIEKKDDQRIQEFTETIKKMKNGLPTWPVKK